MTWNASWFCATWNRGAWNYVRKYVAWSTFREKMFAIVHSDWRKFFSANYTSHRTIYTQYLYLYIYHFSFSFFFAKTFYRKNYLPKSRLIFPRAYNQLYTNKTGLPFIAFAIFLRAPNVETPSSFKSSSVSDINVDKSTYGQNIHVNRIWRQL